MSKVDLDRLCRRLGYSFQDLKLLKRALTHRSYGQDNNERLEFLGDSILNFVIAHDLFNRFPQQTEGELSRLRSFLVKGQTLAEVGLELQLGDYLLLGQGELKSGGFRRESILADAMEAIFAALYFDGGIEASKTCILRLYHTRLEDNNLRDTLKDPKTQLQELLQSLKKSLPEYTLLQVEGEEHDQVFHVACSVSGYLQKTEGKGNNRRKAEQEAAKLFLYSLQRR